VERLTMPWIPMELRHPIDAEVRERLRKSEPNQIELAKRIGRSQGWVNKYMNGGGTATIDDLIRIAAAMIGVESSPLTGLERRLLKAFRGIQDAARRDDAVLVFEGIAKGYRRAQPPGSAAPAAHTPPATSRKARGKRKASGE
jgi:transcriptional regulator with XRE-family HTH domain